MIQFTDEMREAIDNALANGTPCIVATASSDGVIPTWGTRAA